MSTSTSPSSPMSSSSDSGVQQVTQQQQQHETPSASYQQQQEEPMEPQQHVQQTGSQSEDDEQPLQELESATSFVPAPTAPASPGKPSYGELQLRCQMLEAALEQQRQSSQTALTATLAAHAQEESSLRAYYEAQVAELLERLADVHLAGTDAAEQAAPDTAMPASSPPAAAGPSDAASLDARPDSAAARAAAAGRPASPAALLRRSRVTALLPPSPGAAGGTGADEAVLLRRELLAAESLLQSSQEENRAAAKRIKDLEAELGSMRLAVAEGQQRALMPQHQTDGAAAAERLSRILQLEGQLMDMQVTFGERERDLMRQLEAARQQRSAAEARAAAAVSHHSQEQAEGVLVASLRAELSEQAEAHQRELTGLRDRLQDTHLAQHAATIAKLQAQLQEALNAAGHGQKQRIQELEQQVIELQSALNNRRPAAVVANTVGQADELAAAAARTTQLEIELEQQQQQHNSSLRVLQQQCEALKLRLEEQDRQLQASAGSRARLKDLSQQVEQQRDMFTRRVRDLEAKLAAATAAAAGRVSSSGASASSSRRGRGTVRKASDSTPSRRVSAHTSAEAVGQQHQLDENAAAVAAAEAPSEAVADAAASPLDQLSGSALLRLRDRQVAALSAQLDERTSQVLQLQQQKRALERQLKKAPAAAVARSPSTFPPRSARTTRAAVAPAGSRMEQPQKADIKGCGAASDVTHSPDAGVSPAGSPSAAGRPWPLMQQLEQQRAAGLEGAAAASWPALCAELEGEVEVLRAALASREQEVAHLHQQHQLSLATAAQVHHSAPAESGVLSMSAQQLLSVAEDVAAREAQKWGAKLTHTEQLLAEAQAEAAALRYEVDAARVRGAWAPGVAAFDALERKIAALEAAATHEATAKDAGGGGDERHVVELLLQQQHEFEVVMAAKNAELSGFRRQVDALLQAVAQLQH